MTVYLTMTEKNTKRVEIISFDDKADLHRYYRGWIPDNNLPRSATIDALTIDLTESTRYRWDRITRKDAEAMIRAGKATDKTVHL